MQGSSRVMSRLVEMCVSSAVWFVPSWSQYLSLLESAVQNGSTEVSVAAISAVQEAIQAQATQTTMLAQPILWEAVIQHQQRIVSAQLNAATSLLSINSINNSEINTPRSAINTITEPAWQHWNKTTTQIIASEQALCANARKVTTHHSLPQEQEQEQAQAHELAQKLTSEQHIYLMCDVMLLCVLVCGCVVVWLCVV
jgi:hypothetical protein